MAVPTEVINQNISLLSRSLNLNDIDKATLQKGEVVEINVNNQIVSAGIDLNEDSGLRIANGDIITWREDAKANQLPKYNFGLFGCWMADDDNVLSYVDEDNYTPELLSEYKRAQSHNAANANMQQLKM